MHTGAAEAKGSLKKNHIFIFFKCINMGVTYELI